VLPCEDSRECDAREGPSSVLILFGGMFASYMAKRLTLSRILVGCVFSFSSMSKIEEDLLRHT
jgi:hypothetical protein